METLTFDKYPFLKELGLSHDNLGCYYNGQWHGNGPVTTIYNPTDKQPIARVKTSTKADYEAAIKCMELSKKDWFQVTIPQRGDIVRQIGETMRAKKVALGALLSLEMGKIKSEGLGEVQEFIDCCDMACGLARSLNGKVIPSERPDHMMLEQWNPLGIIAVISAFNFPCAVFGWNFAIAAICGDLVCWKGASTTSLITIAVTNLVGDVLAKNNMPLGVLTTVLGGGSTVGEYIINDPRHELVSFTGSTPIGKRISSIVHGRFGRTILELGGNNACIIMDDANLDLALKAVTFSAVGTAGQRCTSLRRLVVHESLYEKFIQALVKVYSTIKIGNPLDEDTLMGPLHTKNAIKEYQDGLVEIQKQGGKILYGGKVLTEMGGHFVQPTIVTADWRAPIVKEELFVPIMYVFKFKTFEEAVEINNSVPQGLSSSIFTNSVQNSIRWVGPLGSDCGIVNVNIGPSGAEIGGAFGGEKETGGGRESGSDSWKQYMRRSTCTINYGKTLPLAQGVKFDAKF